MATQEEEVMAKRQIECGRCGRVRYEDRLVQGSVAVHHNRWTGEPDAFRPVEYWECYARSSCKAARKERNRARRVAA